MQEEDATKMFPYELGAMISDLSFAQLLKYGGAVICIIKTTKNYIV